MRSRIISISVLSLLSFSVYGQTGRVKALGQEVNRGFSVVEKCLSPCDNSSHEVIYHFRLADAVWANFNNQLSSNCLAELKNLNQGHIIDPSLPSTKTKLGLGCHPDELVGFVNWSKSNRICVSSGSPESAGGASGSRQKIEPDIQ